MSTLSCEGELCMVRFGGLHKSISHRKIKELASLVGQFALGKGAGKNINILNSTSKGPMCRIWQHLVVGNCSACKTKHILILYSQRGIATDRF